MPIEKILKYVINFGLCLILIIPFIVVDSMFFPYITGKVFTFRIIVEIIFGLWLILIIKDKEFRPRWSCLFGAVGVFVLILLLSAINAVSPYKAFWSNYERMEGWIIFIHLMMYFVVLGSMLNTKKLWLWFFRLNLFIASILAIQSVVEGAKEEIVRIAGPLGNPIYISVYFLFIFFISLILLYKDVLVQNLLLWKNFKNIFLNILFYVYLFISGFSLYIIYRTSRGALLGVIVGILFGAILITILGKELKVIRQLALGGIILVVCLSVTFLIIKDTDFVGNNPTLSRLAEISWSNTRGNARQMIWPIAIQGFKEKPILGWGLEGFNYVFNKYYNPALYGQESWFDRAHNTPLDFLIAGGILGFFSYMSLFICALYLLWFRKKDEDIVEKAILTGLLIGYLFQALFVFDNLISYIMFFLVLAYIHSRSVETEVINESLIKKKNSTKQNYFQEFIKDEEYQNYIIIPTIVILIGLSVWWVNLPAIQANKTLIKAIGYTRNRELTKGVESFKSALAYGSMGNSEIREQLIQYTPSILRIQDLDDNLRKEFATLVITEANNQINNVPYDARYYFLMGALLNIIAPDQALSYINKSIELSPQKQAMRFQLIKNLSQSGKTYEAMLEARSTYELDTNYEQARLLYLETIKNEIINNPAFKFEGEDIIRELNNTLSSSESS